MLDESIDRLQIIFFVYMYYAFLCSLLPFKMILLRDMPRKV